MRNLLFKISYKGTAYHGYQIQDNAHTVAAEIQNALNRIFNGVGEIKGCSRTDAGVHANEYYFSTKTDSDIGLEKLRYAFDSLLPDDISAIEVKQVPDDFHARYTSVGKEYIYKMLNTKIRDPFECDCSLHFPYELNIDLMNEAASKFLGEHDFKAFAAAGGKDHDTVRNINICRFERSGRHVIFRVRGDGFLYKMVRTMAGTLLQVNSGRFKPDDIKKIIDSKDRRRAGITAKPHALYLNRVFYSRKEFENTVIE